VIASTQMTPVARQHDGKRELVMLRPGLIPYWAKDPKIAYKMTAVRAPSSYFVANIARFKPLEWTAEVRIA